MDALTEVDDADVHVMIAVALFDQSVENESEVEQVESRQRRTAMTSTYPRRAVGGTQAQRQAVEVDRQHQYLICFHHKQRRKYPRTEAHTEPAL